MIMGVKNCQKRVRENPEYAYLNIAPGKSGYQVFFLFLPENVGTH